MIVTLCGSARFEDHFKTWNEALTMAGHTVFTLTRYPSEKGKKLWYTDAEKKALDEAHKRKINASEAVLILNVFGYMGPSTLSEIEHAKARRKQLFALESWGKGNGISGMHHNYVREACRRAIPYGYVGSPIDTTSWSGFRYAYDLLDDVVTGERLRNLVTMVRECDDRVHGRADSDGVRPCINCATTNGRHHISCAHWKPDTNGASRATPSGGAGSSTAAIRPPGRAVDSRRNAKSLERKAVNLTELEAAARAATPGPWHWTCDSDPAPGRVGKTMQCEPVEYYGEGQCDSHCVALTQAGKFDQRANAAFIALANPSAVLQLLEVVKAAKACDRQLSMSALQPDSDEAIELRAALKGVEL